MLFRQERFACRLTAMADGDVGCEARIKKFLLCCQSACICFLKTIGFEASRSYISRYSQQRSPFKDQGFILLCVGQASKCRGMLEWDLTARLLEKRALWRTGGIDFLYWRIEA